MPLPATIAFFAALKMTTKPLLELQVLPQNPNVFVAPARHIYYHNVRLLHPGRALDTFCNRVRRFQRRNNSFQSRQFLASMQRFFIAGRNVFRSSLVVQPCMLRTNRGIIQTCGNRMRQTQSARRGPAGHTNKCPAKRPALRPRIAPHAHLRSDRDRRLRRQSASPPGP